MKTEIWQRIEEIFDRVVAAPPERRAALLDEACGDDAELRAEVESLLEHYSRAGEAFLASPIVALRSEDEASPAWAQSLVGRKVGRYTIVRPIGHGGMGSVFEARQEQPARTVALKVLRPGFSAASALARFRLEPELLGRLQHPNIAQVFEAGVHVPETSRGDGGGNSMEEPIPYFAMEYIADAKPLLDFAETPRLSTQRRLELFTKVCDAIHHGHQKGIIHRDIKPANILVGADGEPKVIDFGVARASDADIVMTTQCTHIGDLVGTVHYMSPEQCDGDPALIDTRSDIYSLGVVLYELLTGASPYETTGTTVYEAIRTIKEATPRRPSTVIGGDGRPIRHLRGDIEAILLKTLEKEPARRYTSADDLARDVRRHLAGEPIDARPPGPWRRLLRWAGRRPVAAAVMSAIVMFTLVAAGTLASLEAFVSYYYSQPVALELSPDRTVAELLSRRGRVLHRWRGGPNDHLNFAELVAPNPDKPNDIHHVLIGFRPLGKPEYAGQLRLYDLRAKDLDAPVWSRKLDDLDLPEKIRASKHTAEQFGPVHIWLYDVFPETETPRSYEIVCVFYHRLYSWAALCVYDLNGELLQRIWHDGCLRDCYWMARSDLLVLAGQNQEISAHERGCQDSTDPAEMPVIFAIRAERGLIQTVLLDSTTAGQGGELAWYKWLNTCPIPQVDWSWNLESPLLADPACAVGYSLNFEIESGSKPQTIGGINWCIDADGNTIPGTLAAPSYRLLRNLYPEVPLPAPEKFDFQNDPPGQ